MLPSIYKKQNSRVSSQKRINKPTRLLKSKSMITSRTESKLSLHDIVNKTKHSSYSLEKSKSKKRDSTTDNIKKILQNNQQRNKLLSLRNKNDEIAMDANNLPSKGFDVIYENKYDLQSIVSRINTDPLMLHSTLNKSLKTTFNKILLLNTSLKFFFDYKPNDIVSLHNIKIVYNSINIRNSNLGLLPKVLVIKCDEFKEKCLYLVDMKKFNNSKEDKFHKTLTSKLTESKDWVIQISQTNTFDVLDMEYCIKWRIISKPKRS